MKKLSLIYFIAQVLLVNVSTHCAQAQIINTTAGNGTGGYSGDGGAATAAELKQPWGVAVDGSGNVYIADADNSRIRKVNTSGIISTFAGTGTGGYSGDGGAATAAELWTPHDIAVDAAGNVYIADAGNERIRKVNTSGIISTIAGNGYGAPSSGGYSGDGGAATAAELNQPMGVAVDGSGNVYFADADNWRIRKVNTSGIISTFAGTGTFGYSGDGGAAIAAELSQPNGVAVDVAGNVYIADLSNDRIRKVNTSGIISTIAGNGYGAGTPTSGGYSGDGGAATAAELNLPAGIAVDGSGNVFIADDRNNRIREVNSSGIISTIAGNGYGAPSSGGYSGDGGAATSAELYNPTGVAITASGNLYIADEANSRIREVTGEDAGIATVQGGSAGVSVYPNPATHQITITAGQTISNITVYNVQMCKYANVQMSIRTGEAVQIDVSDFPAGVYFIEVTGYNGNKTMKKLIRE